MEKRVMKNRIEFVNNEPYCRFDGILMTPENCKNLYGYEGEINIYDDDTYEIDNTIYTDKKFSDLIKILGDVHNEIEEYDEILSQGRGFASHCAESKLNNTVVIPLTRINHIDKIKPFKMYKEDYPNLNIEKYIEFMDCLETYYKNIKKN